MGLFQVNKPKSAGKIMIPAGSDLSEVVLSTLEHIAQMTGVTLGPGGRAVLLERGEMNMKPIITKDGVTVIKHLGYADSIRQLILESARDAAMRTASEAGDGTTTATVLSNSITKQTNEQSRGSRYSPQKLVRDMQALLPFMLEKIESYKVPITVENYETLLLRVATLSANGDVELAKAVIEAFDTVGEEGNMTIAEVNGSSKCTVERIDGYTIETGYEDSAKTLGSSFVNDRSGTAISIPEPVFVLYNGTVTDTNQILDAVNRIGNSLLATRPRAVHHIVVVANGFSDTTIGDLQINWNDGRATLKVYPVVTPKSAIANSESGFLQDLQTYTGSPVYNPINKPLTSLDADQLVKLSRAKSFEATRFRSTVIAEEDQDAIQLRVDELKEQLKKPESEYEQRELEVRIGKLTSGIARLNISGPSAGETRERRDRADDAWCAIRGAIKSGILTGGGYTMVRLSADLTVAANKLSGSSQVAAEIISKALLEPVRVLYANYGYQPDDVEAQLLELMKKDDQTFDILEERWVGKDELLDAAPAVIEAIRNSLSIASLLGTIGGVVAFERDADTDREEQQFARRFERAIGENE